MWDLFTALENIFSYLALPFCAVNRLDFISPNFNMRTSNPGCVSSSISHQAVKKLF